MKRQRRELRECGHIFLAEEQEWSRTHTPVHLETSIGMASDPPHHAGLAEPVEVVLEDGSRINVTGRIDRIDRVGKEQEPHYAVVDYKTGSPRPFQGNDLTHQGRVIQHVIYRLLAQRFLEKSEPGAKVIEFGFFFTSRKGQGERMRWTAEELTRGLNVLHDLGQLAAAGAFTPTDQPDDCRYCDYTCLCGDLDAITEASSRKRRNLFNTVLEPFRRLRGKD